MLAVKSFWSSCRRDPLITISNTPAALTCTLIGALLVFGIAYSIVENASIEDALYWAVTTMSTTGYGDVTPETTTGKVLAGCLMIWSIFYLLPAAIYHIGSRILHDRNEWTHEEQVQLGKDISDIKTKLDNLTSKEN